MRGCRSICAILVVAALAVGLSAPGWCGETKALQLYQKAERKLERGDLTAALDLVNRALAELDHSKVIREGMYRRYYYPLFLRGRIHLENGEHQLALADFDGELAQGVIQENPEALRGLEQLRAGLDDVAPEPIVELAEIRETEFEPIGSSVRELVTLRVAGHVREGVALDSVAINGDPVKFEKSGARDDQYEFDTVVTVEAGQPIWVTAADRFGNQGETTSPIPLPELDLGTAAREIHAVVVGVNNYDKDYRVAGREDCLPELSRQCASADSFECYPLPDLSASVNDAERFAQLLALRGVPRDNIHLLVSDGKRSDASLDRVLTALAELEQVERGKAIFYFSGHGVHSSRQQNLMLLSDTRGYECTDLAEEPTPLEMTALGVDQVRDALMKSGVDERYIILDACRSPRAASTRGPSTGQSPGFAIKGLVEGYEPFKETPDKREPVVFYATREQRVSVEWVRRKSGYFTWFLLQGLRMDLPLSELGPWVQRRVAERTRAELCFDDVGCPLIQEPYLDLPRDMEERYELQETTYILGRAEPGARP